MAQDQLYNNVDEAIIPAGQGGKIKGNLSWEKTRIVITSKYLIYKGMNSEGYIPLNNIFNMDKKLDFQKGKGKNILNFFYTKDEKNYFGLIRSNQKSYLKRSVLVASISSIPIYYISPYRVGGRINTSKEWERGILEINPRSMKIKNVGEELVNELSEDDIYRIDSDKVKGHDAVKISYEKNEEEFTDLLYSPGISLSILYDYFEEILIGKDVTDITISELEKEMILAIESGINSSKELSDLIESDHEKVLNSLKRLKEKGLIEEIGIDKIVDLTSQGKKKIGDSIER